MRGAELFYWKMVRRLARQHGFGEAQMAEMINALCDEILHTVFVRGERVVVPQFGTFDRRIFQGGPLPGGAVVGRRQRLNFVASSKVKGIAI